MMIVLVYAASQYLAVVIRMYARVVAEGLISVQLRSQRYDGNVMDYK